MSEFDAVAPFYDLEFDSFMDDLPLYAGLAARGGATLELGCGTGRLLRPLAAAGHRPTGIDVAPAMLARAAARLEAAGLAGRATLIEEDMRRLERLGRRRFGLIFCAINSFLHLPDQAAQLAALRAARRHLAADGRLALDLLHPHPDLLADYDGRLVHEATFVDPVDGGRVDKLVSRTLDSARQTIHTLFIYDRLAADGRLERRVLPFAMRYIHRYELELLLAAAGLAVEALLGDYDLSPFAADSPQLIVVARRA